MNGYVDTIEKLTVNNSFFRRVLYTTKRMQLVIMSLAPNEDIGLETHDSVDQFFRIEEGEGKIILDGEEQMVKAGDAIVVPAGTEHNLMNTSGTDCLKLYTIYMPPEHKDKVIHETKANAIADKTDHYQ